MLWLYITLLAVAQAGLFSKSQVLKLTSSNFREQVLTNDNVTVVEFYAPWCGHCQSSAPELKKSAKGLNGIARVGAVNCDAPENRALCAHYKIEGFPTIKVFQPAKKTDRDFELINGDQEIKRKKHRVINYKGPRDSRSINKFAVSKIRNYAATLEGDMSFVWLRANGVPRVIMLPGSKYKSKTIAPLFKTLSNEFFGKMRFAYIPRRADGGWNLLGLQAPENSTLVYMSDDKSPYVYKGELTKSKVTSWLNEQYGLEMIRRKKHPISSNDNTPAFGLEYVLEDAQEEPLLAVEREEQEFQENWNAYNFHINSAREKRARAVASKKGIEYTPLESTSFSIKFTRPWTAASAPTADPDLESFDDFTPAATATGAVVDGDDVGVPVDEEVEEAEIDDGEGGSQTELEDYTDAMLDELNFDLAPEDVLADGPEAVAAWKEKMQEKVEQVKENRVKQVKRAEEIAQVRIAQMRKKQDKKRALKEKRDGGESEEQEPSPTQQLPPGITPKPINKEKAPTNDDLSEEDYMSLNALNNIDDMLENCVRREKVCVLCSSSRGFVVDDVKTMLRTRLRFDGRSIQKMVFQFYDEEVDPDLLQFSEDFGISPYSGTRKSPSTGQVNHFPGVAIFDYTNRKFAVYDGDFTSNDLVPFISNFMLKKSSAKRENFPLKYLYYVTENDMEIIDKFGTGHGEEESEESVHDEL